MTASAVLRSRSALALLLAFVLGWDPALANAQNTAERIRPFVENPRYWQYGGRPVVLLGGSKEHNLFQIPDLEQHLRLLASVGGNYVRNTMSARERGNVQPFARLPDGRYDLARWNDEYWRRFERLLRLARELDIIVQIEIWDRFDYSRDPWRAQPFNPKNNVNYTYAQSGFAAEYPEHPGENRQPFFFTTPRQKNNAVVLEFQHRFVDELLRRSLPYPNVLYCVDNETSGDEAWGAYWAEHLRARARAAGVNIAITQMWDDWDLRSAQHRRTFDHPQRYDFVDISQNNHQRGENHWQHFQWARRYLETRPRPINTVKTYGADALAARQSLLGDWLQLIRRADAVNTANDYGSTQQGIERWWRHLIGGAAAVRFHRPPAGIGLNADAQRHIRSARLFLDAFDIVRAVPDADHSRLAQRQPNEAYLTRIDRRAYAVYFPDGGDVRLRPNERGRFRLRWLDIGAGRWHDAVSVAATPTLRLQTPNRGHWLALFEPTPKQP